MRKKSLKKSRRTRQEAAPKAAHAEMARVTSVERDKDVGPDYGGLPERDLKKNLGCG